MTKKEATAVRRERVEMVGGSFAIKSIRGKGTTIRAEIPWTKDGK